MRFLSDLLCHKRAMLDFTQPSSRTFLSFYAACQILGIRPAEVRDPSISSEMKGESREDSVRTFSSYFDMIIMRTPLRDSSKMVWNCPTPKDRSQSSTLARQRPTPDPGTT